MATSSTHRGWKLKHNEGILAAVYNSAMPGTTLLAANTALDGVFLGTPVVPALSVDSIVISNLVANGDILIAANNGGNSQAWVSIDSSAGTMSLLGAGTAAQVISATAVEIEDNILLALGNDQDTVLLNRAATLDANTALTGVFIGTPVTPALAANSFVLSNATDSGDILLAANLSGNSQAWLWVDTSASVMTLYGAGTAVAILSATAVEIEDGILLALGNDQDTVLLNRVATLNANTALTGVLLGTPVTPALAANSFVLSNTTASGDILLAANLSGNSQAWLWVDSSASVMTLYGAGTAVAILSATAVEIEDNILLALGNDQDTVLLNNSAGLNANTALTGALLGTPVTPAIAANSVVLSNTTASGDILLAANLSGNSQAWLWVDSSASTMTLYGAGTAVAILSAAAVEIEDNILLALGNDQDVVLVNNSAGLNANTALTGALIGTPVTPAIAANSLVIANATASGDILVAANLAGSSKAWLWVDTSASLMTLFGIGVSAVEIGTDVVFNEASADRDFRIESNGNANMFVIDAGLDVMGIGGAVVADNTVTVTNAAVAATGRIMKLAATVAAAAQTDGYGVFEVDVTLSNSPTNHTAAESAWINITGGTVPAGTYICARNDGIYEADAATITNAKLIFGARMQYICTDTDSLRFPFSLNTNNAAITALFDCNNLGDFGTVSNAGATAAICLPLLRDSNGNKKYVLLYDLA